MPRELPYAEQLQLPVISAPMFLVSGPELTIAACKAGVIGSFPSLNARTAADFEQWLQTIEAALSEARNGDATRRIAPFAVNLIVLQTGDGRFEADLELCERYRVPLIISSVGSPKPVLKTVQAYGGRVFHDVVTLEHARKAAEAGVDGLVLVCAGAGGHTGALSPFAFVPQVRRFFDGTIVLAGGISDGAGIRAARELGADFAYMGTRFAATQESMASAVYKDMLIEQGSKDVVLTPSISGLPANYLRASIAAVGLDPDRLPPPKALFKPDIPDTIKAWRDVWGAGHGVGMIDDVPSVQTLVERLRREFGEG